MRSVIGWASPGGTTNPEICRRSMSSGLPPESVTIGTAPPIIASMIPRDSPSRFNDGNTAMSQFGQDPRHAFQESRKR